MLDLVASVDRDSSGIQLAKAVADSSALHTRGDISAAKLILSDRPDLSDKRDRSSAQLSRSKTRSTRLRRWPDRGLPNPVIYAINSATTPPGTSSQ